MCALRFNIYLGQPALRSSYLLQFALRAGLRDDGLALLGYGSHAVLRIAAVVCRPQANLVFPLLSLGSPRS